MTRDALASARAAIFVAGKAESKRDLYEQISALAQGKIPKTRAQKAAEFAEVERSQFLYLDPYWGGADPNATELLDDQGVPEQEDGDDGGSDLTVNSLR